MGRDRERGRSLTVLNTSWGVSGPQGEPLQPASLQRKLFLCVSVRAWEPWELIVNNVSFLDKVITNVHSEYFDVNGGSAGSVLTVWSFCTHHIQTRSNLSIFHVGECMQSLWKSNRAPHTWKVVILRAGQTRFCFWLCAYLLCGPVKTPSYLDFGFKISTIQVMAYTITKISSGSTCPYLDNIFKNTDSRKLCFPIWLLSNNIVFYMEVVGNWSRELAINPHISKILLFSIFFLTKLTFCWERFWISLALNSLIFMNNPLPQDTK